MPQSNSKKLNSQRGSWIKCKATPSVRQWDSSQLDLEPLKNFSAKGSSNDVRIEFDRLNAQKVNEDMDKNGQKEPIHVRVETIDGVKRYTLISGHHRVLGSWMKDSKLPWELQSPGPINPARPFEAEFWEYVGSEQDPAYRDRKLSYNKKKLAGKNTSKEEYIKNGLISLDWWFKTDASGNYVNKHWWPTEWAGMSIASEKDFIQQPNPIVSMQDLFKQPNSGISSLFEDRDYTEHQRNGALRIIRDRFATKIHSSDWSSSKHTEILQRVRDYLDPSHELSKCGIDGGHSITLPRKPTGSSNDFLWSGTSLQAHIASRAIKAGKSLEDTLIQVKGVKCVPFVLTTEVKLSDSYVSQVAECRSEWMTVPVNPKDRNKYKNMFNKGKVEFCCFVNKPLRTAKDATTSWTKYIDKIRQKAVQFNEDTDGVKLYMRFIVAIPPDDKTRIQIYDLK